MTKKKDQKGGSSNGGEEVGDSPSQIEVSIDPPRSEGPGSVASEILRLNQEMRVRMKELKGLANRNLAEENRLIKEDPELQACGML